MVMSNSLRTQAPLNDLFPLYLRASVAVFSFELTSTSCTSPLLAIHGTATYDHHGWGKCRKCRSAFLSVLPVHNGSCASLRSPNTVLPVHNGSCASLRSPNTVLPVHKKPRHAGVSGHYGLKQSLIKSRLLHHLRWFLMPLKYHRELP